MWEACIVEAKAVVLGLKMALQCGAKSICVESDCLQVVQMLNTNKWDGSYLGIVVREASSIASAFDVVSYNHVVREANEAAHAIAHLSPLDYSTRIWVGGYPSLIEDVISADFCLTN